MRNVNIELNAARTFKIVRFILTMRNVNQEKAN